MFPSQELLERFMEAGLGLEDFLDSFQSSRKTYHICRAKAEKVQELSQARQQPDKSEEGEESSRLEEKKSAERAPGPHFPNGFRAPGALRVFQVRYGLRPAILLPHHNVAPASSRSLAASQASSPPAEPQPNAPLSPAGPPPGQGQGQGQGQAVGLRLIGQLAGVWPASGRPLRLQQLYRLRPQQTEPPSG